MKWFRLYDEEEALTNCRRTGNDKIIDDARKIQEFAHENMRLSHGQNASSHRQVWMRESL
jgi:hypothetical protein